MRVVEILGVPGAGKSTLAGLLAERLPDATSLEAAVRSEIARRGEDRVARSVAKAVRSPENRLWNAAYARSSDRFAALSRFIAANPSAMHAVTGIQMARASRDLQPATTLGWALNLMARHQLATEAGGGGWLVIDEGFAQRGLALLAGGFVEADLDLVPGYVDAVPRPDVVVVVDTPVEVCAGRLDERGWSERLADRDPEYRAGFLTASSSLVAALAAAEEAAGARVIWVSGTTPPPASADLIAATLSD